MRPLCVFVYVCVFSFAECCWWRFSLRLIHLGPALHALATDNSQWALLVFTPV